MAVDKLVDSAALDTALGSIATAIRSKTGESGTMTMAQMPTKISNIPTKQIVEWHQCPTLVRNYLDNVTYNPSDYTTTQIGNYAPTPAQRQVNAKPIGTVVDGVTYYNEPPNTNTPFSSANTAGILRPSDRLRWLKTTTINVRDLGGWTCDGGTVKYGKLFRGGEPNVADKDLMVNQVGVKHELNLRGNDGGIRDYSVWGIGYTQFDRYIGYALYDLDLWKEQLRTVFDCVLHDLPLYFHCTAGGDRTGTLAVIIEAILGLSQSDIDKDYELTCFDGNGDTQYTPRNRTDYVKLINLILALSGNTFRDKVVNWVASLGFTAQEINDFRAKMIDGTPATLSPSVPSYTITNNLTSVSSDNTDTTTSEGKTYKARLTPASNKSIDTFSITMGGVGAGANAKTVISGGVEKNIENHYIDIDISRVTGNLIINAVGASRSLPSAYQQVEYIRTSDANSFIDSGILFDQRCIVKWQESVTSSGSYVWGAAESSGRWRFMHSVASNTISQVFGSHSTSYLTAALSGVFFNKIVEYECNSNVDMYGLKFKDVTNNVSTEVSTQTYYTMTNHIYLLAQNYNGTARSKAGITLYWFKYYDKDGVLAASFVPCYRKADGVIGLYDVITGSFKSNGGTGVLVKGNDVQ